MDTEGNFYGQCVYGGANGIGWVFELTNCSQHCTLVDLHDFTGRDGGMPSSPVTLDANGNLYGATEYGRDEHQLPTRLRRGVGDHGRGRSAKEVN